MEILAILFLVAFIATIMSAGSQQPTRDEIIGVCPPHQWYWEEIKDADGVVHAHRMVCRRCGPLKERTDGREEQQ